MWEDLEEWPVRAGAKVRSDTKKSTKSLEEKYNELYEAAELVYDELSWVRESSGYHPERDAFDKLAKALWKDLDDKAHRTCRKCQTTFSHNIEASNDRICWSCYGQR